MSSAQTGTFHSPAGLPAVAGAETARPTVWHLTSVSMAWADEVEIRRAAADIFAAISGRAPDVIR